MEFQNTREWAQHLDAQDELKEFRNEFIIPSHEGKEAIYFLGNSLGLQPRRTNTYIQKVLHQWSELGVESFFKGEDPWLEYHGHLVKPLATIVGALSLEVVAMNQLSVNLHLMLVSFYKPLGRRRKIICEAKAFPSDQYVLETHIRQRGLDPEEIIIEVQPAKGKLTITPEDIIRTIKEHAEELALVFWGGVNYYTGQVFDMAAITHTAHQAGALAGFDLAHAVGNIPLKLHEWDVDFACWCSYKYLNSGPGGIGGAYIHQRYHNDPDIHRFAGWWGNRKETQFLMAPKFEPAPGAEGWQLSTPSPLLYAAHRAALELFQKAGMEKIFAKGQNLNRYLWFLLEDLQIRLGQPLIRIITPKEESERGCQVSMLMTRNGKEVFDFLSQHGVFADWREPDVIRIAPVPLYNTFEEVWQFSRIMESAFKKYDQ